MDNQRLLVWATFGILLWFTYQTWMQDYGPAPVTAAPPADTEQTPAAPTEEQLTLPELGEVGGEPADETAALPGSESAATAGEGSIITVRTDVLELQISTRGGTLIRATLLGYPVEKDRPNDLVELLSPEHDNLGLIRTGLRSATGATADQDTVFGSPRSDYVLGDADEIAVPLTWTDESGVTIEKRFLFTRGSYAILVQHTLDNASDEPWRGDQYTQLLRRSKGVDRSMFDVDSYSFGHARSQQIDALQCSCPHDRHHDIQLELPAGRSADHNCLVISHNPGSQLHHAFAHYRVYFAWHDRAARLSVWNADFEKPAPRPRTQPSDVVCHVKKGRSDGPQIAMTFNQAVPLGVPFKMINRFDEFQTSLLWPTRRRPVPRIRDGC